MTIILPSMQELRAYYAALPPKDVFPDYEADSCLIARPVNEGKVRGKDAILLVIPGWIGDGELEIQMTTSGDSYEVESGRLDDDYNELGYRFDHMEGPRTYAKCVALIDEFITREKQDAQ